MSMKNQRTRAFTLVELLVVISIIALLVGILLPAISRARDNAKVGQSKSNIRNIKTASDLYANDHDNNAWTGAPSNLASGPDGTWTGLSGTAAINAWANRYWSGNQGGAGGKTTIIPGIQPCETDGGGHWFTFDVDHIVPYCYGEGLTTSPRGYARMGTFRFPNSRHIAEYMEDKCYHKAYWAPKDRVLQRELQQCWDDDGTTCATSYTDGSNGVLDVPFLLQPSSYCYSPPNMVNAHCYRVPDGDDDPTDAFTDPMEIPAGFRPPTMAQAKHSGLKTFLMETHWMQNLTTGECGANWADSSYPYHVTSGSNDATTWSYDGCYPHYFNASWRSQPVACFVDGHVGMVSMEIAEKHDFVVAKGNNSTGNLAGYKGLWHRGVAGDYEDGFFVECRSDWGNCSIHTHTAGGLVEGRDLLPEN